MEGRTPDWWGSRVGTSFLLFWFRTFSVMSSQCFDDQGARNTGSRGPLRRWRPGLRRRLGHSPRVTGDGARPGFAAQLPAPAHIVPHREPSLPAAGLCCGCHALDWGHGGVALFPAGLLAVHCPVAALARGVQISARRCDNTAPVLRDATAGPAGLGVGAAGAGSRADMAGRGSDRGRTPCRAGSALGEDPRGPGAA